MLVDFKQLFGRKTKMEQTQKQTTKTTTNTKNIVLVFPQCWFDEIITTLEKESGSLFLFISQEPIFLGEVGLVVIPQIKKKKKGTP